MLSFSKDPVECINFTIKMLLKFQQEAGYDSFDKITSHKEEAWNDVFGPLELGPIQICLNFKHELIFGNQKEGS